MILKLPSPHRPFHRRLAGFGALLLALAANHLPAQPVVPNARAAVAARLNAWGERPLAEVLAAANGGDNEAGFVYWSRTVNAVLEESDVAQTRAFEMTQNQLLEDKLKMFDLAKQQAPRLEAMADADLRRAAEAADYSARIAWANRLRGRAEAARALAHPMLERAAQAGLGNALFQLGCQYLGYYHPAVPLDEARGVALLRQAADQGGPNSAFLLGGFFSEGRITPRNDTLAVDYFRRAADQNLMGAQFNLALLYAEGRGEPRGEGDAPAALLRKAAAQGSQPAWRALAERYRTGLGVARDYVRALRCYERAGPEDANGSGASRVFNLLDERFAPKGHVGREWLLFARVMSVYLRATTRADAAAMLQLGDWYETGRYMPPDLVEAGRWYHSAAGRGAAEAGRRLAAIRERLTAPEKLRWEQPPGTEP